MAVLSYKCIVTNSKDLLHKDLPKFTTENFCNTGHNSDICLSSTVASCLFHCCGMDFWFICTYIFIVFVRFQRAQHIVRWGSLSRRTAWRRCYLEQRSDSYRLWSSICRRESCEICHRAKYVTLCNRCILAWSTASRICYWLLSLWLCFNP